MHAQTYANQAPVLSFWLFVFVRCFFVHAQSEKNRGGRDNKKDCDFQLAEAKHCLSLEREEY